MAAPKTGSTAKKRSDEQHGHISLAAKMKDTEVEVEHPAPEPPEAPEHWTYAVRMIWDSLLDSPLRFRFERGDWSFAYYVCDFLTDTEKGGYPSGKMMTARQLLSDLMLTESARLSNNVRINRPPPEDDPGKAESLSRARARRAKREAS